MARRGQASTQQSRGAAPPAAHTVSGAIAGAAKGLNEARRLGGEKMLAEALVWPRADLAMSRCGKDRSAGDQGGGSNLAEMLVKVIGSMVDLRVVPANGHKGGRPAFGGVVGGTFRRKASVWRDSPCSLFKARPRPDRVNSGFLLSSQSQITAEPASPLVPSGYASVASDLRAGLMIWRPCLNLRPYHRDHPPP
jgi:hypothetical protein